MFGHWSWEIHTDRTQWREHQGHFSGLGVTLVKHDVLPWFTYFWGVMLRAYREFEERVGTIQTSRGAKMKIIERTVERQVGAFSISDIEQQCPGVSRDWLRIVLRRLRKEGRIAPRGRGRGAKWVRIAPPPAPPPRD